MAKNGIKIDFDSMPSHKGSHCHNLTYSDKIVIDREVKKLLDKKVIYECDGVEGESISPVFTRPKKRWESKDDTKSKTAQLICYL